MSWWKIQNDAIKYFLSLSSKSSREDMCRLPTSFLLKLSCEQIGLCPQYSKSRQTGSGHAADIKMCYTIQFSILMLCAKYQEAGLCGTREKCDRNFLWRRQRKTTDSDPYMSPPLKRAGDTKMQNRAKEFNKGGFIETDHFPYFHTQNPAVPLLIVLLNGQFIQWKII